MRYLNIASAGLTISGAMVGLWAAYWWWLASTGKIEPTWTIEPGETEAAQEGWIAGIMTSVNESAERNRKAAKLTAVAILLGVAANILGVLDWF
jgi:hypothetical protein